MLLIRSCFLVVKEMFVWLSRRCLCGCQRDVCVVVKEMFV